MGSKVVVARRSGVIVNKETGARYRVARGSTYADADCDAVRAQPELWADIPVQPEFRAQGDPEQDGPSYVDLIEQLAEMEETAASYQTQLTRLATFMESRGYLTGDIDRTSRGWLVDFVTEFVARLSGEKPVAAPRRPATNDEIRMWARANGHAVADKGALPKAVVEAYQAAHGA